MLLASGINNIKYIHDYKNDNLVEEISTTQGRLFTLVQTGNLDILKDNKIPPIPITAEEALRYGLINQIVPGNEVLATSQKLAATLCERGPLAIKAGKRAMEEGMQMTLSQGLELEHQLFDELAYTADAKEGVAAFIERRTAEFEGR